MEKRQFNWRILIATYIYIISTVKSLALNPLDGRVQTCLYEGEPVAVDHIDKFRCFSCICKNGFVECIKDFVCPPTEGCHNLAEKTEDGCCQKCKGCNYKGRRYASHTEWTDDTDPCKSLRCEAGVITESDVKCHTPCPNPLPPEPGTCCKTCPECRINGQIATDDRDVISDDVCLKCRCTKGKMVCSKKACPVLQCPSDFQYHPKGECCPRCNGSRALFEYKQTCTLQTRFFREGKNIDYDSCTNCTCMNETSICRRHSCPILDCAPEWQKPVPGSCCKKCDSPEEMRSQCEYKGKTYENGQSWQLDACSSCKCNNKGMALCAMTKCNVTLPCSTGTRLVRYPGECCGRCEEVEGICTVFGDHHYKTFDGKMYSFHAVGKFQLVNDCEDSSFSIRIANAQRTKNYSFSTSTRRVAIRYAGIRINLQQKTRVKVDGEKIKLPFKRNTTVKIENVNDLIELQLQNGIKIFWNGMSFLEVSVPAVFKNKLCGLCGNFNSNVQDDLKMKNGRIVKETDLIPFGMSWCIGRKSECNKQFNPKFNKLLKCANHGRNYCKSITNDEIFGACESKVHYSKYYKLCKMDMCNCQNEKCYCDSFMSYARECERMGVNLDGWKKKSGCTTHELRRKKPRKPPTTPRPRFRKEDLGSLFPVYKSGRIGSIPLIQ